LSTVTLERSSPGRRVPADAARPLYLNDTADAWSIEHGGVDVFCVALEAGAPVGAREHICRLGPGQMLFGVQAAARGAASGLIAVGLPNTQLCHLGAWREALTGPALTCVEDWVRGLTRVFKAAPPRVFMRPHAGGIAARAGQVVYDPEALVWMRACAQPQALERQPAARPLAGSAPQPLTPSTWVLVKGEQQLRFASTAELALEGGLPRALDAFHETLLADLAERRTRRDAEVAERLEQRRHADAARFGGALASLAAVIAQEEARAAAGSADAVLEACQIVMRETGIDTTLRGDTAQARDTAGYIRYLARQARVAFRQVAIGGERWWREDAGPLLGFREGGGAPVALLPSGAGYLLVDPASGVRAPVNAETAAALAGTALMFFRSFPERALGLLDLARFALGGVRADGLRLVLFGALAGLLGLFTPIATGLLIDSVIPAAETDELVQLVLLLVTSALAIAAFELARGIAMLRIETRIGITSQAAIMQRLLHLPVPFFRSYSAGDLAQRAFGIDGIIHVFTGTTQAALFAWIFGFFSLAYLFALSVPLALLASALVAVSLALATAVNLLRLRMERELFQVQGDIASRVLQILNGIGKLRAAGAEKRAFAKWAESFSRQKRLSYGAQRIANYVETFDAGYVVLASLLLFAMVAFFKPELSTGAFLAFNTAFGQFMVSTLAVGSALTSSLNAVPLYERAKPILHTLTESATGAAPPGELSGPIDISHVSFRYSADGPLILDDVSIRVAPGEFVAFVGPSGSGKSTLFRLLLGFEQPAVGAVYYDGQDLAGLDIGAVRRQLGVVLQNGQLVPGDIFTNIVGASPYTLEDAWEAARLAGFAPDVESMPMGMHTVIAEGAATLSGGQKQRLMIARALVRRPRILLFDEATSALDNATQAIVAESVERLAATRIVIAHRLSTIVKAHRIYVIVAGRLVESGTYDELMARGGTFAELARRQIA